ncbi:MAG: helix-turn-helix domain-containing protein [Betaproteobacteria bacterium]|nr:helix-turn-helix domain-containing protein [Betaproteobacteria bacterium]
MISEEKNSAHFGPAAVPAGREVPIGIVAGLSGCGIETIRFYEKAGVLPRARRTESGRRVYDDRDIARITFIRRARELGFSLNEVRGLLALAEGNGEACEKVQSVALRHLDEIAAKISDLTTMQAVLNALIARCEQGDDAACPLIAALSGDRLCSSLETTRELHR